MYSHTKALSATLEPQQNIFGIEIFHATFASTHEICDHVIWYGMLKMAAKYYDLYIVFFFSRIWIEKRCNDVAANLRNTPFVAPALQSMC